MKLLILSLFLCSVSFASSYHWKNATEPGTFYYWDKGTDVGSSYYWKFGQEAGSNYYWKYGTGPGSSDYWARGTAMGSSYSWERSVLPGSKYYWDFGTGPGSKYYWDMGTERSFGPIIVSLCMAQVINLEMCSSLKSDPHQKIVYLTDSLRCDALPSAIEKDVKDVERFINLGVIREVAGEPLTRKNQDFNFER